MIGFRTGKSWIGVTVWLKDRKCQTQTLLLVIGVVSDNVRWQGLSGHILTWHCEVLLSSACGLDYQDNGECQVSRNQCCLLLGLCWGRGLDTALDGNSVYMGDRHLAWKCPFLLSWRTPLSLEGAFRISWASWCLLLLPYAKYGQKISQWVFVKTNHSCRNQWIIFFQSNSALLTRRSCQSQSSLSLSQWALFRLTCFSP